MAKPGIKNSEGRRIPLIQDVNFSDQWRGILWPQERGWHKLNHDTIDIYSFYVAAEGSWNSLNAENTMENNRRYFDRSFETRDKQIIFERINPLWFYGLFLLCMGGLWIESKLYSFYHLTSN